jgi:hypothetical protein
MFDGDIFFKIIPEDSNGIERKCNCDLAVIEYAGDANPRYNRGRYTIYAVPNFRFYGELHIVAMYSGRSAKRAVGFVSNVWTQVFVTDVLRMASVVGLEPFVKLPIKGIRYHTSATGVFEFCKRGSNFGLKLSDDQSDKWMSGSKIFEHIINNGRVIGEKL